MGQTSGARLVKNTVVYMVGNLSSKIFQMLILPILTTILLTEEYGYYDLIINTVNLVTPLITLQLGQAIFRFLFTSNEEEKRETISSVTIVLFVGIAVLGIIILVISHIGMNMQYPELIYLCYVAYVVYDYMQKIARSQQKNTQVAISGVINTVVMLGTETVTLLLFQMRVDGLLLSYCIAHMTAAAYLESYLHVERYVSRAAIRVNKIIELLRYSFPLVPNGVCWWVVSACDRYIISFFMSLAANGIYSIASKFAQLLSMVTSVFQMAWQESSILEEDKESRDQFYTSTFSTYMRLLVGGYVVCLPAIRLIMPFLVAVEYQEGYRYVPMLLLGAVFSAFSQFYGSAYLVFKKTNGAISTTLIAAFVNVITGVCFIKDLGLLAPALGTSLAFFVQWILRIYQMREYFKVKLDYKYMFFSSLIILVCYGFYFFENTILQLLMLLFGGLFFVVSNKEILIKLLEQLRIRFAQNQ